MLCPKTNDIPFRLKLSSESDTDETVFEISCGPPLSTPKNRSDDRGSRRGELWCIYGTSVRVAVIKRAHFLPLLRSHRVSFPSISSLTVWSTAYSLSLARTPSFFLHYLYSSPFFKHQKNLFVFDSILKSLLLIIYICGDMSIMRPYKNESYFGADSM